MIKNLESFNGINLGDYVVSEDYYTPMLLTKIDYFEDNSKICIYEFENNERLRNYSSKCEKWIPKKDEFCFFSDDNNIPLLGQLQEIKNNIFIAKTFDGKGNENIIEFKNCKPFKTSILNEYIKK